MTSALSRPSEGRPAAVSSTLTATTGPVGTGLSPVRGLVATTVGFGAGVGLGAVEACVAAFGCGLLHPPLAVAASTPTAIAVVSRTVLETPPRDPSLPMSLLRPRPSVPTSCSRPAALSSDPVPSKVVRAHIQCEARPTMDRSDLVESVHWAPAGNSFVPNDG